MLSLPDWRPIGDLLLGVVSCTGGVLGEYKDGTSRSVVVVRLDCRAGPGDGRLGSLGGVSMMLGTFCSEEDKFRVDRPFELMVECHCRAWEAASACAAESGWLDEESGPAPDEIPTCCVPGLSRIESNVEPAVEPGV